MEIKKNKLKTTVNDFLVALDKNEICTIRDLEYRAYTNLPASKGNSITIEEVPSSMYTDAYSIRYSPTDSGLPIIIMINPKADYSIIMLDNDEKLSGYTFFGIDPFKNKMQYKRLPSSVISDIKEELSKLLLDTVDYNAA